MEALALIEASDKPEAKQWEASVRSNLGEALYDIGRYDEALLQFRRSLTLRENKGDPSAIRDAQWHVARVLRVQKRTDEALVMQLRLERESRAAGNPKHYIFEELALLYQSMGDKELAKYYAIRAKALAM